MSTYLKAGALIEGIDTTATAGGTTALSSSSKTNQQFTGTSNQIVTLPDATTLAGGSSYARRFEILNRSTGIITVNNFSGTLIGTVSADSQQSFLVTDTSTSAGVWALANSTGSAGGTASVSNSDELKMLQSLASQKYNDGSIATKLVKINPEEMGSDFWTTSSSLIQPLRGIVNHGFTLNGLSYIPSGQTTSNVFVTTSVRYDAQNNYWLSRAVTPQNITLGAGFNPSGFGYLATGWDNSVDRKNLQQYTDSTDTWVNKNPIVLPRFEVQGYTFQTYGFISGGRTAVATAYTATSERYDPSTDYWINRAGMNASRAGSGNFTLQDVPYAILGFNGSGAVTSSEKYDPVTNIWSTIATSIQTDRCRMISYNSCDRGYVTTGQNNANSTQYTTSEYFSPIFNTWISAAPIPSQQRDGVGLTQNHLGIAAGGFNGAAISTVVTYRGFKYHLVTQLLRPTALSSVLVAASLSNFTTTVPAQIRSDGNTWKNVTANDAASILRLNETLVNKFENYGNGYIIGGATGGGFAATTVTQTYSETSNTWSTRGSMGATNIVPSSFMLAGELYIVGGATTSSGPGLQTSQKYNELTNSFTARASFASSGRGFAGSFPLNELGYLVGGFDYTSTTYGLVDQYNPVSNAWTSKTALPAVRNSAAGFALNNRGYAAGGGSTGSGGSGQTSTYQYDDVLNAWATKAVIPAARLEMGGATVNGFGFATAGRDTSPGPTNTRYKYNDQSDSWTSVLGMSTNKTLHATLRVAGQVFDCGGRDPSNSSAVYAYNDAANLSVTKGSLTQTQADMARGISTAGSYKIMDIRVGVPALYAGLGGGVWITRANFTTNHSSLPTHGTIGNFGFCIAGGSTTNERFDKTTNTVMVRAAAPNGTNSSSGFSLNGTIFSNGGSPTNTTCVTNNDRYSDDLGVWVSKAVLPSLRGAHAGEGLNDFGYSISGASSPLVTGASSDISNMDQYNHSTDAWTSKTGVNTAVASLASASFEGSIYKFNGQISSGAFTNIAERFSDAGNTWTNIATTSQSKYGSNAILHNKEVLITGGIVSGPTYQSTVESYYSGINAFIIRSSLNGNRAFAASFSPGGEAFTSSGFNPSNLTTIDQYMSNVNSVILGIALEAK